MKLLVFKGNDLIQELNLETGSVYTAGRQKSCDIKLDKLPGISREHFQILEDDSGLWTVNVLSKVASIQFDGEDCYEVPLDSGTKFNLPPYSFEYSEVESSSQESHDISQDLVESPNLDLDENQNSDSAPLENEKTFVGNEEKTSIQNFSGTPYVKIVGQNGKKSEFFRLEGNLWVAGKDDSASIYIPDPSAVQSHFEISKTDKGYYLSDLGSAEGTSLNGQKLEPHSPARLLSGDIINVGQQSLQFELRDQSFKKKVSNIPLNMYQNPLVFFDQETALVTSSPEEYSAGRAEEVQLDEEAPQNKRKKFLIAATAVVVLISVIFNFMDTAPKEDVAKTELSDPFSKLDPAQQKIVVQTHKLAKQLYLNGNFELALVQLQKLHSILPLYKDSQEMEEYCINSRDLKRQQALIEQQKREQEYLEQQVASYVAQCSQKFSKSHDLDGAKACLAPAINMDPNNAEISQIFADITARQEERKIRIKLARERADKIRRGKDLYVRAKQYHRKNNFLKAIEAYENHIHSGLPDPDKLVNKSKRSLSSIEYMIRSKKNNLMGTAKNKYSSAQLKDAVQLARKAQKVDPYDQSISLFLAKIEKELTNKVKAIYMDSVIEERFGNLEASRLKWEEILRIDVENGVYYNKSIGKMKEYGFKH